MVSAVQVKIIFLKNKGENLFSSTITTNNAFDSECKFLLL